MKKILLTTAACAVLASSPAFAAEGDFYVKANGGWSKLNKINVSGKDKDGFIWNLGKGKSKNDGYISIGVGYSVMDNARVDLTFEHLFNPQFSTKVKDSSGKSKLDVDALLINGYIDLFDVSIFKMHVGGGVGTSRIAVKNSLKDSTGPYDLGTFGKIKSKNYFAYGLQVGASAEVAPSVYAELTYNFKDFGKVKNLNKQIQAHQVGAGVRFEI